MDVPPMEQRQRRCSAPHKKDARLARAYGSYKATTPGPSMITSADGYLSARSGEALIPPRLQLGPSPLRQLIRTGLCQGTALHFVETT
jgi:hypothetical protein